MAFTYEVIKHDNVPYESIKRTDDKGEVSFIPMDESNSDYQRYLNPEVEQSTPNVIE